MSAPRQVEPLTMLALQVACIPPPKPYDNAHTCYMPWSLVEDIRRALEAKGINWRALAEPVRAQRTNEQARWVKARRDAAFAEGRRCPECHAARKSGSPFATIRHFSGCSRRVK